MAYSYFLLEQHFLHGFRPEACLLVILYTMFYRGLLIGAVFMATDYATCPMTHKGRIIYDWLWCSNSFVQALWKYGRRGIIGYFTHEYCHTHD